MTTWQLESTGRYPQALKDHLARFRPGGREPTQREAYLEAWDWLDKNGFRYHNVGHSRCTGRYGFVDCSGGIALCRNAAADRVGAGRLGRETDESSYSYSRLCHSLPRPQWMIDEFGPGRGYQITPQQANVTPAALKIIGRDEGQDYTDRHGHIESKAWPANMAVGAFSHASGVGYRIPFVTTARPAYYAIPPYLDGFVVVTPPPSVEQEIEDMLISAPAWQQTSPNRTPTVGLDLAKNSLVRRNGPRFVDSAGKPAGDAIPVGANKAVGMFETFESGEKEGFTVQTSADASGNADFHYVWVKKPGG